MSWMDRSPKVRKSARSAWPRRPRPRACTPNVIAPARFTFETKRGRMKRPGGRRRGPSRAAARRRLTSESKFAILRPPKSMHLSQRRPASKEVYYMTT